MIKEKIARMMCETYALESMTYLTTGLIDAGVPDYSLENICKVFGSEHSGRHPMKRFRSRGVSDT